MHLSRIDGGQMLHDAVIERLRHHRPEPAHCRQSPGVTKNLEGVAKQVEFETHLGGLRPHIVGARGGRPMVLGHVSCPLPAYSANPVLACSANPGCIGELGGQSVGGAAS